MPTQNSDKLFYRSINLQKNQLKNAVMHTITTEQQLIQTLTADGQLAFYNNDLYIYKNNTIFKVTLNDTTDLLEGDNLYFTEDRVLNTKLTGFDASNPTDVTDNSTILDAIKYIYSNLGMGGSGTPLSIINILYNDFKVATLIDYAIYYITDRQIIYTNFNGVGKYYYLNYATLVNTNNNININIYTNNPYNTNNIVIYNNFYYRSLIDNNTSLPTVMGAWLQIPITDPLYVKKINDIVYDKDTDIIYSRVDSLNNKITYSPNFIIDNQLTSSDLYKFRFDDPYYTNNVTIEDSIFNFLNSRCYVKFTHIISSTISLNNTLDGQIVYCIIKSSTIQTTNSLNNNLTFNLINLELNQTNINSNESNISLELCKFIRTNISLVNTNLNGLVFHSLRDSLTLTGVNLNKEFNTTTSVNTNYVLNGIATISNCTVKDSSITSNNLSTITLIKVNLINTTTTLVDTNFSLSLSESKNNIFNIVNSSQIRFTNSDISNSEVSAVQCVINAEYLVMSSKLSTQTSSITLTDNIITVDNFLIQNSTSNIINNRIMGISFAIVCDSSINKSIINGNDIRIVALPNVTRNIIDTNIDKSTALEVFIDLSGDIINNSSSTVSYAYDISNKFDINTNNLLIDIAANNLNLIGELVLTYDGVGMVGNTIKYTINSISFVDTIFNKNIKIALDENRIIKLVKIADNDNTFTPNVYKLLLETDLILENKRSGFIFSDFVELSVKPNILKQINAANY